MTLPRRKKWLLWGDCHYRQFWLYPEVSPDSFTAENKLKQVGDSDFSFVPHLWHKQITTFNKKSQALSPVTFQSNSKCTLVNNAIIVTVHVNLTNLLNWWTSNDLLIFFRVGFHHQVIHLFVIFLNLSL